MAFRIRLLKTLAERRKNGSGPCTRNTPTAIANEKTTRETVTPSLKETLGTWMAEELIPTFPDCLLDKEWDEIKLENHP